VLASHSRFGLSDGASSQIKEELSFLQDTSCQDFSYLEDFDLLLLSPDHPHTHYEHINQSNTEAHSNLYNKQQIDYNNQSDYQNQSYYQESTIQFTYTFADLPIPCELLDTSQAAHSSPAQTQKTKLSNAERCKIFRDRQKNKVKQLLEEKDKEEKKNTELNIRAKFLEDKVAKLKKIYFKRAKTHQMILPGENVSVMFDC